MRMRLAIDNEHKPAGPARESAMPALRSVADTVLGHLAEGETEAAIRFMSAQRLAPIALGFVATCLLRRGVGEKDIEAVLLH